MLTIPSCNSKRLWMTKSSRNTLKVPSESQNGKRRKRLRRPSEEKKRNRQPKHMPNSWTLSMPRTTTVQGGEGSRAASCALPRILVLCTHRRDHLGHACNPVPCAHLSSPKYANPHLFILAATLTRPQSPSPPMVPRPKGKRAMDAFLEEIKRSGQTAFRMYSPRSLRSHKGIKRTARLGLQEAVSSRLILRSQY